MTPTRPLQPVTSRQLFSEAWSCLGDALFVLLWLEMPAKLAPHVVRVRRDWKALLLLLGVVLSVLLLMNVLV